ncbi:hypothetical protein Trydic_g17668 [Trypoxylus dichotomus]
MTWLSTDIEICVWAAINIENPMRVNGLIAHTKAVSLKFPECTKRFHEFCPKVPEPPQPILNVGKHGQLNTAGRYRLSKKEGN